MAASAGRELLAQHLPIDGRGAWLVRAFLAQPRVRRFWRLWLAALASAAAVAAGLLRRRRRGPPAAAVKAAPVAAPAGAAAGPPPPAQQRAAKRRRRRFTELLQAESPSFFRPVEAAPELATLIFASAANAWLMLYKAWLMREFVTGQNLGRWRQWLQALAKFPFATLAGALLSQTTKYTQARVALLWRRAATRRLMKEYFSGMNYYKLLHLGSYRIEDPDVRLCSDLQSACDALTGVFISGLSGFTNSLFSSWALYRRRGIGAVALPYLYSFVLVPASFTISMPDWGVVTWAHRAWGAYQQALTRMQVYGEGIAMLQGENFERSVINERTSTYAHAEKASWAALAKFDWVQHIFSNPAMPGVWQTFASFGAAFIALRAADPGRKVVSDPTEPNEALVYEYGANISDFWQVLYGVRGASTFMMALDNYKRSSMSLLRVEELQEALTELREQAKGEEEACHLDGEAIAFQNVSVATPTGVKLVADLTFEVQPGRHLVICGHNGAGKSSIFRCLGRLWPVASGKVTCPLLCGGAAGLHGVAYYLPQRPVNILGTLSDQLTYPRRVQGGLPEAALRQWLLYVDLEHLVEAAIQAGDLNQEADWAVKLSLGEQQRLGIARVLYHRPRFAILDECTSAVSKDMERRLFELARALGISCVTITHRPALQEHHHQMLRLTGTMEEDGRGWELVDLPSKLPVSRKPPADEGEAHARIQELLGKHGLQQQSDGGASSSSRSAARHQEARSEAHRLRAAAAAAGPEGHGAPVAPAASWSAQVQELWPTVLHRICAVLQLESTDRGLRLRFAQLLLCMLLRPQAAWEVYRTIGGSVTNAMCHDWVGLLSELLVNLTYMVGLACLDRHIVMLGRGISLELWSKLSADLHGKALAGVAFHRLQTLSSAGAALQNPLQQVTEAKSLLEDLRQQLASTGGLAIQMLYFFPMLLRGGGILPAFVLAGLYLTHYMVRTRWMPNFKAITARHSDFENHFQVAQTRMRHVAEAVAFSGGGDAERLRIEEHFERLCQHRLGSMLQEFTYNFLTEFFIVYDNLPIWFHRVLSFNFAYRNEPAGGASPASAVQNYLYDRTIAVSLVGVQTLTAFHQEAARIDARASRLLALRQALESLQKPSTQAEGEDRLAIAIKDLDLVTPNGVCLAEKLSFSVQPGGPLLVTGPNGCGKTALARVLLGLWEPAGEGAMVAVPPRLMIVPQKPYLAPGSLGDQVTYPQRFNKEIDCERASAALAAVGVGYLVDRTGWEQHRSWEDVLSGGEQQRVILSRVLFHRPAFALLDECTSMVAVDAEQRLYKVVIEEFGVTPVTFSQRLFLGQFHRHELRLGDDSSAGWALDAIHL